MTNSGNLNAERRYAFLRARLEKVGQVRIDEAAGRLGVSEMTVRRDLAELESLGEVRRVRGGAVALGPLPFAERDRVKARAKATIAAKLLSTLPPTGVVGFDASSTMLRLARAVDRAQDLTVMTNGWQTCQALSGKPGVRALLTGGEIDDRTGSLVGPLASFAARSVLLTTLYVSAAAADPVAGPSEATLAEADVKRALASVAGAVIVAIDASKLGTRSVARTFEWAEVSLLVTELDPGDRRLDPYRHLVSVR